MKLTSAVILLFSTTYCIFAAGPNRKQNFCQNNRCLTCVGRYCTTTCQGESCKNCPLGDCCNGTNCNICRGDTCCTNEECNNCITNCLQKCQGSSTCHYDCFQECLPDKGNSSGSQGGSKFSLINNVNYVPVNVTTIINITNSINSENAIYNPIIVNTTNFNNYTSNRGSYHRKEIILNDNKHGKNQFVDNASPQQQNGTKIDQNIGTPRKYNCCEIVHPELCHTARGQNGILCYTGKHQECSQLCIAKHVHIVENQGAENSTCIAIANPPYFLCGKYAAEDCDSCYICSEEDNADCPEETDCTETCKASIIDKEFYNKLYRKD